MRYCVYDLSTVPFGPDRTLVFSDRRGTRAVLPNGHARLLLSCREPRTLSDHAVAYCRIRVLQGAVGRAGTLRGRLARWSLRAAGGTSKVPVPQRNVEAVRSKLDDFARRGLLTTDEEVHDRVRCIPLGTAVRPTISTIGILTCDRPACLRSALEAYLACGTRIVVSDDSRSASVLKMNGDLIRSMAERLRTEIVHADRSRRLQDANEIAAAAGISPDIMRFALLGDERCGPSMGASNNALLLYTAGEATLISDDDVLCRCAPVPDTRDGLMLTSEDDPNEYWFFDTTRAAQESIGCGSEDILAVHERMLGRTVGSVIAGSSSLHTNGVQPIFLKNAHRSDAHIGVTMVGAAGDSGMERNLFRLLLRGHSFRRLVANYASNVTTRAIVRAPGRATITNGVFCMGMNLGLDNREMLPPFMPVQRNSDGLFSVVLKVCFPHVFRGLLPYAVIHAPPEVRPRHGDNFEVQPRTNDLLISLVASISLADDDPVKRMRALGRRLTESAAEPDFDAMVRRVHFRSAGSALARIADRLATEPDASVQWAADVRRLIAAFQSSIVEDNWTAPADLPGSVGQRKTLFKELVSSYGRLLTCWPEAVQAAQHLEREAEPA